MPTRRSPTIGLLLAALLAWASGCDEERREDCPDPPYTCTARSACLHEGGSVLDSYTCGADDEICCDVP